MGFFADIGKGMLNSFANAAKYVPEYEYLSDSQLIDEHDNVLRRYNGDELKGRRDAIYHLLSKRGYAQKGPLLSMKWVRK